MPKPCYMCDLPSTSKEHVPPRCIFPESKDSPDGKDYRQQLLTVPSCDLHNTAKSDADEYFMMVIASFFANNGLANNQIRTKISRAWCKKPTLAKAVCKNISPIPGTPYFTFEIDTPKFESVLEHIAHGLYFKSKGHRSDSPFKFMSYPATTNIEIDKARRDTLRASESFFSGLSIHGSNTEIFSYQITPEVEGTTFIRMNFYEAFTVVTTNSTGLFKNET